MHVGFSGASRRWHSSAVATRFVSDGGPIRRGAAPGKECADGEILRSSAPFGYFDALEKQEKSAARFRMDAGQAPDTCGVSTTALPARAQCAPRGASHPPAHRPDRRHPGDQPSGASAALAAQPPHGLTRLGQPCSQALEPPAGVCVSPDPTPPGEPQNRPQDQARNFLT